MTHERNAVFFRNVLIFFSSLGRNSVACAIFFLCDNNRMSRVRDLYLFHSMTSTTSSSLFGNLNCLHHNRLKCTLMSGARDIKIFCETKSRTHPSDERRETPPWHGTEVSSDLTAHIIIDKSWKLLHISPSIPGIFFPVDLIYC